MLPVRPLPAAALAAGGAACVATVMVAGELAVASHVAVGAAGTALAAVGLARRSGRGAPRVGRRGLPWLALLAVAVAAEVVTLLDDDVATVSDRLDPLLVAPAARGAATAVWLAVGAWLVTRPRHPHAPGPPAATRSAPPVASPAASLVASPAAALAAALRTAPGRAAVFGAWLWLGIHVLAR